MDAASEADRYFSREIDAAEEACYSTAMENGLTQEFADECDNGSCMCFGCPFEREE